MQTSLLTKPYNTLYTQSLSNILDRCSLERLMNTRRLRAELRSFREYELGFQRDMLEEAAQPGWEDDEGEIFLNWVVRSKLAVEASETLLAYIEKDAVIPTTVGQAVDAILLEEGRTRYSDLVERVGEYYPEIVEQLSDINNSVYAALDYGLKVGKIRRISRGIYERVKVGPTRRKRKEGAETTSA